MKRANVDVVAGKILNEADLIRALRARAGKREVKPSVRRLSKAQFDHLVRLKEMSNEEFDALVEKLKGETR